MCFQTPAGTRPRLAGVNFESNVVKQRMVELNLGELTPDQARGVISKSLFTFEIHFSWYYTVLIFSFLF